MLPSTTHELRFEGGSAINDDAIVVFSDPVFGNRWGRDQLWLSIAGRDCGGLVHSQHDRRFVWSGGREYLTDDAWGRGACTASGTVYPDMPAADCSAAESEIQPPPCEACDAEQAACNRSGMHMCMCMCMLCMCYQQRVGAGKQYLRYGAWPNPNPNPNPTHNPAPNPPNPNRWRRVRTSSVVRTAPAPRGCSVAACM